jgi:hypothetical protein
MEAQVAVRRREGPAGVHLRQDVEAERDDFGMLVDQGSSHSADEQVVERGPLPPAKTLRSRLFTVLFLGLIGLLAGIILGGLIST